MGRRTIDRGFDPDAGLSWLGPIIDGVDVEGDYTADDAPAGQNNMDGIVVPPLLFLAGHKWNTHAVCMHHLGSD